MAHISSKDVVIKFGTESSETDYSTEILAWNGFPIEVLTEEGYGYSSEWVFYETTGIKSMGDITLTMFYDTEGSTAYAAFKAAVGTTQSLRVEFGGAQYKQASVIVASSNISADRGGMVKADFTLRLASAVVEDDLP